jgi:hypothetical protein
MKKKNWFFCVLAITICFIFAPPASGSWQVTTDKSVFHWDGKTYELQKDYCPMSNCCIFSFWQIGGNGTRHPIKSPYIVAGYPEIQIISGFFGKGNDCVAIKWQVGSGAYMTAIFNTFDREKLQPSDTVKDIYQGTVKVSGNIIEIWSGSRQNRRLHSVIYRIDKSLLTYTKVLASNH